MWPVRKSPNKPSTEAVLPLLCPPAPPLPTSPPHIYCHSTPQCFSHTLYYPPLYSDLPTTSHTHLSHHVPHYGMCYLLYPVIVSRCSLLLRFCSGHVSHAFFYYLLFRLPFPSFVFVGPCFHFSHITADSVPPRTSHINIFSLTPITKTPCRTTTTPRPRARTRNLAWLLPPLRPL